jgi:hypothetical protein
VENRNELAEKFNANVDYSATHCVSGRLAAPVDKSPSAGTPPLGGEKKDEHKSWFGNLFR